MEGLFRNATGLPYGPNEVEHNVAFFEDVVLERSIGPFAAGQLHLTASHNMQTHEVVLTSADHNGAEVEFTFKAKVTHDIVNS